VGPIRGEELRQRQEALAAAPLFAHLTKRHLRTIAKVTGVASYARGATLVREGTPGSRFFVILAGRARVTRGNRTKVRLEAGDFFGEISLLDPGPRTASVVAESSLMCLELEGKDFRQVVVTEPMLALRICQELAKRLREGDRYLPG
jgi:CRP-like cAMP-binding protein